MMVLARNMISVKKSPITLSVPVRFHEALSLAAKEAGMSLSFFSETLLNAAWTARNQKSGDISLDNIVRGTLILWSNNLDIPAIAETMNIRTETVQNIIDTYRREKWQERPEYPEPVPVIPENDANAKTDPLSQNEIYEKILHFLVFQPGSKAEALFKALFQEEKVRKKDLSRLINVANCDGSIGGLRKRLERWHVSIRSHEGHYLIPADDKQKLINTILMREASS